MLDERAFISRLEAANARELLAIVARPKAEEERVLRVYLGERRYERLHQLAVRQRTRGAAPPKGNVVVLPGIMGSDLSTIDRRGDVDHVWLHIPRLIWGRVERLRLSDDGRTEHDPTYEVRATGIMKRPYGELLLSLAQAWNVRAFWFDWRKDLSLAADALAAHIGEWFGSREPVHLVAHSMGGLVARTFIKQYRERWTRMWDERSAGAAGGRLIMLGTPNHGSFDIPQAITGREATVRKLERFDLRHGLEDLLRILNSFVGSYQMLPSPLQVKTAEPLYRAETYGPVRVSQRHLDAARAHHERLADVVEPGRMIYIAGDHQPTFSNISDFGHLDAIEAYDVTTAGDGRVPHALGLLRGSGGAVPAYYVDEDHGALQSDEKVLAALGDLLESGRTKALSTSRRRAAESPAARSAARRSLLARQQAEEAEIQVLAQRLSARGGAPDTVSTVSPDERRMQELLLRGIADGPPVAAAPSEEPRPHGLAPAEIELAIELAQIEEVGQRLGGMVVDAVAVGHYINVKPQAAEEALDRAISRALGRSSPAKRKPHKGPDTADLVVTQFTERGTLWGELGRPFFLPDPRDRRGARLIVLAGMGVPGRFGAPELAVLSRELCWALGCLRKRHLATVLIGSGNGNLPVSEAVGAWIRGVKHALTGAADAYRPQLERITFVDNEPQRIVEIDAAIAQEQQRLRDAARLEIRYRPLTKARKAALRAAARTRARARWEREWVRRADRREGEEDGIATRITVGLERTTYRFGAITETASIPERTVPLDPKLVMQANQELLSLSDPAEQEEQGRFLQQLLFPADLRPLLSSKGPVVMLMDAATARIHWEMVGQVAGHAGGAASVEDSFLGTSRGFTRQLRTTFAPAPEPPPPPERILRVLVVGDPADDAPLPGAQAEALEVAALFESFNRVHADAVESRIEVVALIGPAEATRTRVMRELMLRSYDVLHYAGHCLFDADNPPASGWIFSGGDRISAQELNRIDRIPKFVFSNACESGITPDRADRRSVDLAPSFAEAFFGRGVANFVCTGWPVDDLAARTFALRVHAGLLGLRRAGESPDYVGAPFEAMHVAMRQARLMLQSDLAGGPVTWGAYQHYGNPYFRLFGIGTGGAGDGRARARRRPRR